MTSKPADLISDFAAGDQVVENDVRTVAEWGYDVPGVGDRQRAAWDAFVAWLDARTVARASARERAAEDARIARAERHM